MRTSILRSLQVLASLAAVALLTGANDPGCIPQSGGGNTGGVAGGSTGEGGASAGTCDDGSVMTWVCGAPMPAPVPGSTSTVSDPPPGPQPPMPEDAGCAPPPACQGADCPPAPGCVLQCVPAAQVCPAGFHEEAICNPPPPPPPQPGDPNAPDPGVVDVDASIPDEPPPCTPACVPDGACPPGTVQQTVCEGGAPPVDPGDPNTPIPAPADTCWNECVPAIPACPLGTHPDSACPPEGLGVPCTVNCVPDAPAPCPPGSYPVQQCDDSATPAVCTVTCVEGTPAPN